MRKYATLLLAIGIFAGSCNNQQNKKESMNNSNDAAFDSYKERFVEALWQQYPGWASSVGYHKYDSVLIVPDAAAREKEIAFCKGQLDSLKQFDDNSLSDNNK